MGPGLDGGAAAGARRPRRLPPRRPGSGEVLGGEALGGTDTARTLRTVGGERVDTAGPYAETVEHLGGFYVVDLPSVADGIELARLLPDHYTVEVRPIVGVEGYEAPS
ncbi:MAG: hypothetical protein CMH83_00695 [Nocardioides sp.]|nr:hypothetical protein [Nocardioides sp.]